MTTPTTRAWIAALCLFAFSLTAHALDRLRNPNDDPALGDAAPYERFGASVAVDGTTMAIGSVGGRLGDGDVTGVVRIFSKQNGIWKLQQKLVAPDAEPYDEFGASVALEGDTLVVGARNRGRLDRYHRGGAYVFERRAGTWSNVQVLEGPDQPYGFFGNAIALSGEQLAIGASELPLDGISDVGIVSVFRHDASGWHASQTLGATPKSYGARFGAAVLFAGAELLVGAPGEKDGGAVYVFSLDEGRWSQRQRLVGSHTLADDGLGVSLASDGARLLAGAPGADGGSGNVVDWRRRDGAWVEWDRWLAAPAPPDEAPVQRFGARVAQQAGRFVVSAERGPDRYSTTGIEIHELAASSGARVYAAPYQGVPAAYDSVGALDVEGDEVFVGLPNRSIAPWSDAGEVRVVGANGVDYAVNAGVTATYEGFGQAVAANRDWVFVGAPGEHRHSGHSGAVFAYDRHSLAVPPSVLTEPDGQESDDFGAALALSGDTLLVGAQRDDQQHGSVRLYEYDGARWNPSASWPNPADGELFGAILAADSTDAIVGSLYETTSPGIHGGAAYVYQRSGAGWLPPVRLVSRLIDNGDVFGVSVAIDGNVAVVGSIRITGDEQTGPMAIDGAARVFERSGSQWFETVYMERPSSAEPNGEFGTSVAVDGDTIFVGAPLLGEVHVWRRDDFRWRWVQRIAGPAGASNRFGQRLRVVDHELWVASSPGYYPPGGGGLHRYRAVGGEWRLARSILPANASENMSFASGFAIEGGTAFVGTPLVPGYAPFVWSAGAVRIDEAGLFDGGFED